MSRRILEQQQPAYPLYCGELLYVKFVLQEDGKRYRILSFCGDGEEH